MKRFRLHDCPRDSKESVSREPIMGFLSNAPQGFTNAVKSLNQLPQGVLAEMVMLMFY